MGVGVRKGSGVRAGMLAAASALAMVTAAGLAWADEARVWPFKIEAQPLSSALIVLSEAGGCHHRGGPAADARQAGAGDQW